VVSLVETLEDVRKILKRYAHAGVTHPDRHLIALRLGPKRDSAAARSKSQCIL